MGTVKQPQPVKLFIGLIFREESLLLGVSEALIEEFGPMDLESQTSSFNHTDYYEREFGPELLRKFASFKRLIHREQLAEIKRWTNRLELTHASKAKKRSVNIDPGYIEASKLVLATTKNYAHRIYLGRGIYAEVTLRYRRGTFQPLEWTYPDYRMDTYINFFNRVRASYMSQLSD